MKALLLAVLVLFGFAVFAQEMDKFMGLPWGTDVKAKINTLCPSKDSGELDEDGFGGTGIGDNSYYGFRTSGACIFADNKLVAGRVTALERIYAKNATELKAIILKKYGKSDKIPPRPKRGTSFIDSFLNTLFSYDNEEIVYIKTVGNVLIVVISIEEGFEIVNNMDLKVYFVNTKQLESFNKKMQEKYPAKDPDGFRGIKWGAKLAPIKDQFAFQENTKEDDLSVYTRKNDVMNIFGSDLKNIYYYFDNDIFIGVQLVADWGFCDDIHKALKENFGYSFLFYRRKTALSTIYLEHYPRLQECIAEIYSTPLMEKALQKEKRSGGF
jgi:hypothetical protein